MCIVLMYIELLGAELKLHQTMKAFCLIHLLNNSVKTPGFFTLRLLKLLSSCYKEFCSTWLTCHVCIRKKCSPV